MARWWIILRSCFSLSGAKCIELTKQHSVKPSSVRQTWMHSFLIVVISSWDPSLIATPFRSQLFLLPCTMLFWPASHRRLSLGLSLDVIQKRLTLLWFHDLSILIRRNSVSPISNHSSKSSAFQSSCPRRASSMWSSPSGMMQSRHQRGSNSFS